jgi:hypothetical protein
MKRYFFVMLIFLSLKSYSQAEKIPAYLIITIIEKYDYNKEKYALTIQAESGANKEDIVYKLIPYNFKANAKNSNGNFYSNNSNDNDIYNYFTTTTEILNFMGKNGWDLLTINNIINSTYTNEINGTGGTVPITKIESTPRYYFTK